MTAAMEKQLLEDVAEIKAMLIRRESCQASCEKLSRWAFGNGVTGADEVLAELKREADARREDEKRWRWRWRDLLPAVTSGTVVGLLLLLARYVFGG